MYCACFGGIMFVLHGEQKLVFPYSFIISLLPLLFFFMIYFII